MTLSIGRIAKLATLLGVAASLAGCSNDLLDHTFQRMMKQPKFKEYQANEFYADGRAMRTPPEGTLARENFYEDVAYQTGRVSRAPGAGFVLKIPFKVDEKMLARGKQRYEITCTNCHGVLGDGNSMVARNMALNPPPSFHSDKLRNIPDGYFFEVITVGYGVMPSHAWQLSVADRWAVTAYVRALQLSQNATLAEVPADERTRLEKETQ